MGLLVFVIGVVIGAALSPVWVSLWNKAKGAVKKEVSEIDPSTTDKQ